MIISNAELGKNPKLLIQLPPYETGYGPISTTYSKLVLQVRFEYHVDVSLPVKQGLLTFDYCTSYFVVDQNRFPDLMPPMADCLYELSPVVSAGRLFKGFAIWFSDTRDTYIVYAESFNLELDRS